MTIRVLNVEPHGFSADAGRLLQSRVQLDEGPFTRAELLDIVGDYDGVIVRLSHRLDREFFAHAPRLRFLATATTGLDHIDLTAVEAGNVALLSLRNEQAFLQSVTSTAELAFTMMLALSRNLVPAFASVRNLEWRRDMFKGHELKGRTLVVVGVGRLGAMMCEYARAFRMRVIGVDPFRELMPEGVEAMPLQAALPLADVLSVHTKHAPGQPPAITAGDFARLKQGALVINTARGEAIDEQALLAGLTSGNIAGAAVDVLTGENAGRHDWLAGDDLAKFAAAHDNLLITPHIGGATHEAMEATEIFMAKKILAHLGLSAD